MASYFILTLDTTAPSGLTLAINGGAAATSSRAVTLTIGVTDADTTGYQMLIWGIDGVASEAAATWQTYATSKAVTLTDGDGTKTVYIKVRDAVGNVVSSAVSATIELDTTAPTVTVTYGPSAAVISVGGTVTQSTVKWTASEVFDEYKVMVVASDSSEYDDEGSVQIPTTAGSTNVSGNAGDYPADTEIETVVVGGDLQTASAGDGAKHIKVFVKDQQGNWSVA